MRRIKSNYPLFAKYYDCRVHGRREAMMDTNTASTFHNAAGVEPRNDPESEASGFAVERFWQQLARIITPGMRAVEGGYHWMVFRNTI